jgi:hypothetical protein
MHEAEMLHMYAVSKSGFVLGSRQLITKTLQNEIPVKFYGYLVFSQSLIFFLPIDRNVCDFNFNIREHKTLKQSQNTLSYVVHLLTKNTATKNIPEL